MPRMSNQRRWDRVSVQYNECVIANEFWYIWFTLAHFTFGTLVGTPSVLVVVLLVHGAAFWHISIVLGHFG